jgi:hypothetical protein
MFYLLVGDSQLSGNHRERLTACQAYMMAMVSVLTGDLRFIPEVSAHVFHNLVSPESRLAPSTVPGLVDDLIASFSDQLTGGSVEVRALLLWPFLEAKRLAPLRTNPDAFLEALGTVGGPAYRQNLSAKLAAAPGPARFARRSPAPRAAERSARAQ